MAEKKERKSFLPLSNDQPKQTNGHHYPGFDDDQVEEIETGGEEFGLTDELDHEILMQRDAHFGGDFGVMMSYYEKEGVGMHPDIDIERIYELSKIEEDIGQDLAPLILSGSEAEKVARARRAYESLKEIYLLEKEKNPIPRLIADLVLSEEEDPENEMEKVIEQGTKIVPELIAIIQSEDAYDLLFPGYGYAPYFASICLGKIGDPKAITPLFEMIGKETVFDEHVIIEALGDIGDEAKKFLLKVLKSRPLTQDNVHAAIALSIFAEDPNVATVAFELLQEPEIIKMPILRSYLLFCCEGIKETSYKESFARMAENPNVPSDLRKEMKTMLHEWNRS